MSLTFAHVKYFTRAEFTVRRLQIRLHHIIDVRKIARLQSIAMNFERSP
jgi:hypothetical protein